MFPINVKREKAMCWEYLPDILPKGVVGIVAGYIEFWPKDAGNKPERMILRSQNGIIEDFFHSAECRCRGCGGDSIYNTIYMFIRPCQGEFEVTLLCRWCFWFVEIEKYFPEGKMELSERSSLNLCTSSKFYKESTVPANLSTAIVMSDLVGFHACL